MKTTCLDSHRSHKTCQLSFSAQHGEKHRAKEYIETATYLRFKGSRPVDNNFVKAKRLG